MATYKSDESYKNIREVGDVRNVFARFDALLKYMFSNLTVSENFTVSGISENQAMKDKLAELEERVSALERS